VSESLQWRYCDAHGTGTEYAWGCPECVRELRRALKAAESRANELNAMLEHCRDEAAETERMLRAEYANAESRAEETRRLYDELLYQVSMKHLGESRHQTALRYLRQSESNVCWPDSAALAEGEGVKGD